MPRPKKGQFKFEIDQLVRFRGYKAKITARWWDNVSTNRYELRYVIGKNLAKEYWSTRENQLEAWTGAKNAS